MAFFSGWELWQELTFVLACLIAIVFLIGFVKLWRTNHLLRRYELLDEEKRARLAEMQQYGIDIPAINDIPFGPRAIQSGIEVDEIWISRPNTPVPSHRASFAVTGDDSSIDGANTTLARKGPSSTQNASDVSSSKGKAIASPIAGPSKIQKRSTLSELQFSESTTPNGEGPSKSLPPSRSEGYPRPSTARSAEPRRRWSSIQTSSDADPVAAKGRASDLESERVPYGMAEVFANTRTRRTSSGFEILPAGSLGQRVELHASVRDSLTPKEEVRTPNKLQKPRPKEPN